MNHVKMICVCLVIACLTLNHLAWSQTCNNNSECDPNDYCQKAEGDCNGQGTCTPQPKICPLVFVPVCGCDGRTYSNTCEAAFVAVNVASAGPCQEICGGFAEIQCSNPDDFCELPVGQCHAADLPGVCTPVPIVCPEIDDPVCGCDGVTYSNDCFRLMAQVSEDQDGRCSNSCLENSDCSPDAYCLKADGDCNDFGTCEVKPVACPDDWDPVCGCDGQTYRNVCDAAAVGVNIASVSCSHEIQKDKFSVKAGKDRQHPSDQISFSGIFNADLNDLLNANEITIAISTGDDFILVKTIPVDPDEIKNSRFKYKEDNDSLELDFKRGVIKLGCKNVDLSGLGNPVTIEIGFGNYFGSVTITDPIPLCLLTGVADALQIDKAKLKQCTALTVQGSIAREDLNLDLTGEDVTIEWSYGSMFTETILAGGFERRKPGADIFVYKKPRNGLGAITDVALDFEHGTFKVQMKDSPAPLAATGEITLSISSANFAALDTIMPAPSSCPYAVYFMSNEMVADASINHFDPETLNYFWAYIAELENRGRLEIAKPAGLQDCNEPENCLYIYLTDPEGKQILAAKTAHAIFLDKNDVLPWKLSEYSPDELAGIFDENLLFSTNGSQLYYFSVVDHNPSDVYDYLADKQLIQDDVFDTLVAILDDVRADFRHGIGGGSFVDPIYTAYTIKDALSTYVASNRRVSRWGCHSMTRIINGMLRSINIPAEEVRNGTWFDPGHSSALWPTLETVLAHGDHIYNALLLATPTEKFLPTLTFYDDHLGSEPCGESNPCLSHRHTALNSIAYPADYTQVRCCDPAQYGYDSCRDYLETNIGAYLTEEELHNAATAIESLCE